MPKSMNLNVTGSAQGMNLNMIESVKNELNAKRIKL